MKIVFFGTPEFAVPPLEALLNSGHEIIAVVTQPDRQSGRGRRIKPGPVKITAQKAGLRLLQPAKVREKHFIGELEALRPSAIVVVAYGQILPSEIIRLPRFGCINIHASLLPRYRGAAPVNWALINGEEKTGVTTMLMDEGMDTGPVLLQEEVMITPEDTAGTLSARLSQIGADLLLKTLEGLESGSIEPVQQSGDPSYAPRLKKTDGMIPWSKPARELCNFIRGMNPWPGAYGFLEGERVKILKAVPVVSGPPEEPPANRRPGVICRVTTDEMHVCAGSGAVSILEIQPAGKSAMPVKTFLQGRKLREGMSFRNV
ncbi:MAG: methionyl-tRNA formyltransferase [Deferribacteres bacterium]|nr:methionyl-tRNA formyltransferase [Deferribacteres bacterium]